MISTRPSPQPRSKHDIARLDLRPGPASDPRSAGASDTNGARFWEYPGARAEAGVLACYGQQAEPKQSDAEAHVLLGRRRTGPPTLFRFYDSGDHFGHGEPQIPGLTDSVLVTLQEFDGFSDGIVPRDCLRIQDCSSCRRPDNPDSPIWRRESAGTLSSSIALGPANTTASGLSDRSPLPPG